MNQRRRRSSNSRPAVSLDPLYRGEDEVVLKKPEDASRKSKDAIEPSEPRAALDMALNEVDKSAWNYPRVSGNVLWTALGIGLLGLVWGYAPTILQLAAAWEREPDYSHGWFVVPIVGYLLWSMKSSMPPLKAGLHLGGLVMVLLIVALRVFAGWAYFDSLDGWTIPLTVIALAWVFGGRGFMFWALPALGFLFFMVPLPFRMENELSRPLQWIATRASTFVLQLMGQPAISEGTTILLGDQVLEVERACSGLRIFIGVFALSYVYAMLARRNIWEGVAIVVCAIPIALISNMTRIVITGLCYQWFSGEVARKFSHDLAGFFMIGVAAALFGFFVFYIRWLIQDAQTLDQVSLRRV
jgi:exosortase